MAIERTFSMIKPDATKRNLTGAITKVFEDNGLRVVASKRVWMSKREAEGFYAVHKERPFFGELVEGMTSGPTVVQVLEGENAILKNRELMGATNPANADEGTIRKTFALSIGENSVHGSDAPETAARGNRLLVLRHRNRRLNQFIGRQAETIELNRKTGFARARFLVWPAPGRWLRIRDLPAVASRSASCRSSQGKRLPLKSAGSRETRYAPTAARGGQP